MLLSRPLVLVYHINGKVPVDEGGHGRSCEPFPLTLIRFLTFTKEIDDETTSNRAFITAYLVAGFGRARPLTIIHPRSRRFNGGRVASHPSSTTQ